MIELVDYPAIAAADTQRRIDHFHDACRSVRNTDSRDQHQARIALATSLAHKLRERCDELMQLLETGDRWLARHPSDDDEAQWFAAEAEYRAICDALDEGVHLAFGATPTLEQSQMLEVS